MRRNSRIIRVFSALAALALAAAAHGESDGIQLTVTKDAPSGSVTLTWTGGSAAFEVLRGAAAPPGATSALLSELRSATPYQVTLRACLDAACSTYMESPQGPIGAATPQETWQLQGTGSTVSTLTKIVPDGNVKIHAFRHGDDAPAPLVADVATGQAVPVSASAGGLVRLYFEAPGADGKTRILRLDSRDGWNGLDFNAGAPTVCSTTLDFQVIYVAITDGFVPPFSSIAVLVNP